MKGIAYPYYYEEEGWFEFYLQTDDENINFLDDEVQRIEIKEL